MANTAYSNAVTYVNNRVLDDISDVVLSNALANGDFLRYNGNVWINDPVNLSTDTVGNYVQSLVSGTGVSLSNNSGEGSTPTISIGQDVSTTANVSFHTVTANFVGNVTGSVSNISTHSINELSDVVINSAVNGQILEFDGNNWVNAVRPSLEPMGFEDANDSSLDFTSASREFSIQPTGTSFTVWVAGKRFVKTLTETIQIPNTSALYYIYYNSSGTLSQKNTFFNLENEAPVAYIYWNQSDNVDHIFADERHGITMDWATHEYLHRTRGAAIANGFGANAYTTTGSGASDSDAQIDIANGTFFDEDLEINITHSATPAVHSHQQILQGGAEIPMLYRTNTHFRKDAATKFPMKQGSARVTYNRYSAGAWSTTDIDNNKYGVTFIVATNDLHSPIQGIMGQNQYTDQGSAEAAKWEDLDLSDFPLVEWRPLYKIVYQTANAYVNTPNARITAVIDMRLAYVAAGTVPTTPVSDHGSMTGLSDDDHVQYFNDTRHDAHDHSTALASASINDLGDVTISNTANGDFFRWDSGSSAWINDAVNLSTDTVGDYVANLTAGDGIDILNSGGEGSNPTIAIAGLSITPNMISPELTYVNDLVAGNNIIVSANPSFVDSSISYDISTSATPSFDSVTTDELTIGVIRIDPVGAAQDEVLKFNGTKFIPGIASTVAALGDLTDVSNTAPSLGDFLYWDGTQWTPSIPVTGIPAVSTTPPISPELGQIWFNSDSAQTFIYYDSQWIEIGAVAPPINTVTKYAASMGDGTNSEYTINHNLNTKDIVTEVYDISTNETVDALIQRSGNNAVKVTFAGPVGVNSYRIVVMG